MELNLVEYIDRIDSTSESDDLVMEIYYIVKDKLQGADPQHEICNELWDLYQDLRSLEKRLAPIEDWLELYSDIKSLGNAIRNRIIGENMHEQRKQTNLNLLNGMLFYMKLIIVKPRAYVPSLLPSPEESGEEDSCN